MNAARHKRHRRNERNDAINASTARKIWDLLTPAERRSAVVLLGLMVIGMVQTQWTRETQSTQ